MTPSGSLPSCLASPFSLRSRPPDSIQHLGPRALPVSQSQPISNRNKESTSYHSHLVDISIRPTPTRIYSAMSAPGSSPKQAVEMVASSAAEAPTADAGLPTAEPVEPASSPPARVMRPTTNHTTPPAPRQQINSPSAPSTPRSTIAPTASIPSHPPTPAGNPVTQATPPISRFPPDIPSSSSFTPIRFDNPYAEHSTSASRSRKHRRIVLITLLIILLVSGLSLIAASILLYHFSSTFSSTSTPSSGPRPSISRVASFVYLLVSLFVFLLTGILLLYLFWTKRLGEDRKRGGQAAVNPLDMREMWEAGGGSEREREEGRRQSGKGERGEMERKQREIRQRTRRQRDREDRGGDGAGASGGASGGASAGAGAGASAGSGGAGSGDGNGASARVEPATATKKTSAAAVIAGPEDRTLQNLDNTTVSGKKQKPGCQDTDTAEVDKHGSPLVVMTTQISPTPPAPLATISSVTPIPPNLVQFPMPALPTTRLATQHSTQPSTPAVPPPPPPLIAEQVLFPALPQRARLPCPCPDHAPSSPLLGMPGYGANTAVPRIMTDLGVLAPSLALRRWMSDRNATRHANRVVKDYDEEVELKRIGGIEKTDFSDTATSRQMTVNEQRTARSALPEQHVRTLSASEPHTYPAQRAPSPVNADAIEDAPMAADPRSSSTYSAALDAEPEDTDKPRDSETYAPTSLATSMRNRDDQRAADAAEMPYANPNLYAVYKRKKQSSTPLRSGIKTASMQSLLSPGVPKKILIHASPHQSPQAAKAPEKLPRSQGYMLLPSFEDENPTAPQVSKAAPKGILSPRPEAVNRDLVALNEWAQLGDKKANRHAKVDQLVQVRIPKKRKGKDDAIFVDELDLKQKPRGRSGPDGVDVVISTDEGEDKENIDPEEQRRRRGGGMGVNMTLPSQAYGDTLRENCLRSKL